MSHCRKPFWTSLSSDAASSGHPYFLWFISGDERLAATTVAQIRHPQNVVYVSVASLWECVIKYELGKLPLPQAPHLYVPAQRRAHRFESLPITEATIQQLPALPLLHRDPFDRILICQALQHGLTLVTVDPTVLAYDVPTLR